MKEVVSQKQTQWQYEIKESNKNRRGPRRRAKAIQNTEPQRNGTSAPAPRYRSQSTLVSNLALDTTYCVHLSSPQQHLVPGYRDGKHCILHPAYCIQSVLYYGPSGHTLDDDDPFSLWGIKNWFAFSLLFFPALSFFLSFLPFSVLFSAESLNAFLLWTSYMPKRLFIPASAH